MCVCVGGEGGIGGVSNELFTEQRVKITKCFRVSDWLVPSKVCRLHAHLSDRLGKILVSLTISYEVEK